MFNRPRSLKAIRDAAEGVSPGRLRRVRAGLRAALGDVHSSLACPYSCSYCTNQGVYGRQWNALEGEQAAEEMSDLVRRYHLSLLWVVDDNFLRRPGKRAMRHRRRARAAGVKFDWSIQAPTNLVTRLSGDGAGNCCGARACAGLARRRSGSAHVLHLMNKRFRKLEMTRRRRN